MRIRIRSLVSLLAVAAVAGGCDPQFVGLEPPADWQEHLAPADPDIRLLEFGPSTGLMQPLGIALATEVEWLDIWERWTDRIDPAPQPPAVDFGTEMVVVAAMGGRPTGGYAIGVERVERSAERIIVHVFTVSPGDGCVVTMAPTAPAIALAMPASEAPVEFSTTEYVQDC